MNEIRTNLNGLTVGKLKEIIRDVSDDAEIYVWNVGITGFVKSSELEIVTYDNNETDVSINIEDESGYY